MEYPDQDAQVRQAAQDFSGLDFGACSDTGPSTRKRWIFVRKEGCTEDRCTVLDESWICSHFYECHKK